MYFLAAVFAGANILSVADRSGVELAHDHGGIVRSAALGLLLITAGLLSARHGSTGGKQRAPQRE